MTQYRNFKNVLIVEDDIEMSTLIDRVIKRIDSTAILDWSASAEDAIQMIRKEFDQGSLKPYDLIIADIYLDGQKTGLDLLELCSSLYPKIPFILTSANDISSYLKVMVFPNPVHFLKKPFHPGDLRNLIMKYSVNSDLLS